MAPDLFISAFLGFLSAVLVEFLTRRVSDSADARRLEKALRHEVEECRRLLDQRTTLDDRSFVGAYPKATWIAAVSSNALAKLPITVVQEYAAFYNELQELEEWEKIETQAYIGLISDLATNPAARLTLDQLQRVLLAKRHRLAGDRSALTTLKPAIQETPDE
jgi:hypothetical protein